MNQPSVLIGGVGNIFLGDDAFGVEVARRLQSRPQPANVKVVDFGIRGLDLAYALLEPYDLVILVDVVQRGEKPGALYVIEPLASPAQASLQTHGMAPSKALEMALSMGAVFKELRLVGCEPANFGDPEEGRFGLMPEVEAAAGEAVNLIEQLVREFSELSYA